MFRNITIGQYYPTESVIHDLDPRTKLFATLLYIVVLFLSNNILLMAIVTVALALVIRASKVPFSFMVKGLRGVVFLLIMVGIMNLFFTAGDPVFTWKFITITDIGLKNAFMMSFRMMYLIVGTSVMTLTTTPNQLTDGLEKSLGWMKKIGVPVHEIAMMMAIALRFIPILVEETDKIMKAQMARGADFESGGLVKKAKAMIPLLVPLFVAAFRRANDLALAMEARCYNGGDGRTKMKPLKYASADQRAYIIMFLFLALFVLVKVVI